MVPNRATHSKIRSTQNMGVTFLFCLGHGLKCYLLMQGRNQKLFKAGEVSCNLGTSINILAKTHETKGPAAKNFGVFYPGYY